MFYLSLHCFSHSHITGPKSSLKITDHFDCITSNVVYCIKCSRCNLLYIGETDRRLGDRIRVTTIQLNQFPAILIHLTTFFQILLFSVYPWLAATTIVAKPKRCDLFTNWVLLIPLGLMNASLFPNLFIFMFLIIFCCF